MFLYSTVVILIILSVCAKEILAIDDDCPTPYNESPIENCCELKQCAEFAFSEYTVPVKKPGVYKLKIFATKPAVH